MNFSAKLSAGFFYNSWEGKCFGGIILHKTCEKVVTPDVGRDSKGLVSLRTVLEENMFSCVTVLSNQLQFWDISECTWNAVNFLWVPQMQNTPKEQKVISQKNAIAGNVWKIKDIACSQKYLAHIFSYCSKESNQ